MSAHPAGADISLATVTKTVTRLPVVGDFVVTPSSGRVWYVEDVVRDVWGRRIRFIAVADVETGHYPNSLQPDEVRVVSSTDAKRLRARYGRIHRSRKS